MSLITRKLGGIFVKLLLRATPVNRHLLIQRLLMKPLYRLLLGFSLAAAGVILAGVLWINDDYYKALVAGHPDHPIAFPHTLAWILPLFFVLSVFVALASLWLLIRLPPYNWREPSLLLAGMGLVALAFQPINWIIHDQSSAPQDLHANPAGIALSRSVWLTIWAILTGVSFFVFCFRRLRASFRSAESGSDELTH